MAIEPDGPEFNCVPNPTGTDGMVFDHALPVGWILGDFFIEASLLACPTPVCTVSSTLSPAAFSLVVHPTRIPCTKDPQLSREGDKWSSIAWTSVDEAIFPLAVFSRLSHWWF